MHEKFFVRVELGKIVSLYMWFASSLKVMLSCLLQLFFRIKSSPFEHLSDCSWYLSSISWRQLAFGDFCQRFFWFRRASSSACFRFS